MKKKCMYINIKRVLGPSNGEQLDTHAHTYAYKRTHTRSSVYWKVDTNKKLKPNKFN